METNDTPVVPELWAPVNLEGAAYEVSTLGRVRTLVPKLRYVKPRRLVGTNLMVRLVHRDKHGFKQVAWRSLSKLVADTFLPESDLPLIGYRNGNRDDCSVANLYYKDYNYSFGKKIQPGRGETKRLREYMLKLTEQASWDNLTYEQQQEDLKNGRPMQGIYLKGPDGKRLPYAEGETPPLQPEGPATPSTTPQEIHNETTEETLTEDSSPAPRVQSDWLPGALAALDAEIDRELSNEGEGT